MKLEPESKFMKEGIGPYILDTVLLTLISGIDRNFLRGDPGGDFHIFVWKIFWIYWIFSLKMLAN